MTCPNCGKDTVRLTTVSDEDGGVFSFCSLCPRPKKETLNFPTILTSKTQRGRPRKVSDNGKFSNFALTPEEIARTQALRPTVVMRDTLEKRRVDDVQARRRGERAKIFLGGDSPNRGKLAHNKIAKQLGTENFKVVSDDGFRIVAEKLN